VKRVGTVKRVGMLRRWLRRRPRTTVALCRRLSPQGWEHLHTADAHGRGVLLLITGSEPDLADRAARAWLEPATHSVTMEQALGVGRRVILAARDPDRAASVAAALVTETGCALLPLAVDLGRCCLLLGSPIIAADDDLPADLFARIRSALDAMAG